MLGGGWRSKLMVRAVAELMLRSCPQIFARSAPGERFVEGSRSLYSCEASSPWQSRLRNRFQIYWYMTHCHHYNIIWLRLYVEWDLE